LADTFLTYTGTISGLLLLLPLWEVLT